MAVRSRAMVPSTASRVLIQVKEHSAQVLTGLMYNPYMEWAARFTDVLDFTGKLDEMFDTLSFPQATMEYRKFGPSRGKKRRAGATEGIREVEEDLMEEAKKVKPGDGDTFVVHVQFRQNATWQGTVKWAGKNQEQRFRSTLELLKIMDSALAEAHPEAQE